MSNPLNPIYCSTPGLPVHHQLPEFTQTHVHPVGDAIQPVMPSSHLILCHPLFFLPPIPSNIRVFSNESTLHMRWPKYWSFCLLRLLLLNRFSHVRLSATPWTAAYQAPLSVGFPKGRILERVAVPSSRGFSPTHGLNPSFLRLLLWSHLGSLRHHVERIASSLHSVFVSTTNKHFFLPAER